MHCKKCPLHRGTTNNDFDGIGSEDLGGEGLLVVLDHPDEREDYNGQAFSSKTSIFAREFICKYYGENSREASTKERSQKKIRYTYAVRCWPKGKFIGNGIAPCRQKLLDEIAKVKPGKLLALGEIAIESLVGEKLSVDQVVGGCSLGSEFCSVPVYFSMNPSSFLENKAKKAFWQYETNYLLSNSLPDAWDAFKHTNPISCADIGTAMESLEQARKRLCVAIDFEYNDKTNRVLCMAISYDANKAYVIPDYILQDACVKAAIEELFRSTKMIAHNWKYDAWVAVRGLGIDESTIDRLGGWWIDTAVLRKLSNPEQFARLDISNWMVGMGGHKAPMQSILKGNTGAAYEKAYIEYPEVVMDYCGYDAIASYRLHKYYSYRMKVSGFWDVWSEVFGPLGGALFRMESNGMPIDADAMDALENKIVCYLNIELNKIRSSDFIKRLCANWSLGKSSDEFNPKSTVHMRELLYGEYGLGLPIGKKTEKGAPKVDKNVVNQLIKKEKVFESISEFNRFSHKYSTYVKGYRKYLHRDGVLRTSYKQDAARTQRLSSSRPNLQNIPNRGLEEDLAIRRMFIPHDRDRHWLLEVDYSQQELRVAADLSSDPVMLDCFNRNIDIHSKTASSILSCGIDEVEKKDRQAAKAINFGVIFGMSSKGLAEYAKTSYGASLTQKEAETWRKGFFGLYAGYRTWMLREIAVASRVGCAYVYWLGKPYSRRWLTDLGSSNRGKLGHAKRQAVNNPIQGGASLYTLKSCIKLHESQKSGKIPGVVNIIHTIHDSVIAVIDKDNVDVAFEAIAGVMIGLPTLRVPLEVEGKAGPTLADMEVVGVMRSSDLLK